MLLRPQIEAMTRGGKPCSGTRRAARSQVFAPTFPGYGRSEKPAVSYSAELWRDFLRDFVLGVVNRPVVLAGNSIGGYIGASLAADYPDLVSGAH
jgi:pimeloyl-ACP methyl ester carboxylesterase